MENCIFCQIINRKLPGFIISQNESVTAFLDINPVSDGHVLVVPNEHTEKLYEMKNSETVNALINTLIHTANLLVKSGICTDYSIVQSNGKYAEQDINHLHFHIIPRHQNDEVVFKLDTDTIAALKDNLLAVSNQLIWIATQE